MAFMKSAEVRRKFIDFYKARGHVEVPSASLVPENDPTTLFTSSGMQPLVPYLLGEPHPLGTRIVNSQKSFRSQDIEEVGDNRHTTFFEMLGNWSFGDYFKSEQLPWVWEFLTHELGLPKERLYVSVLKGDEETIRIWKKLGIPQEKIYSYGVEKNWWSRAGAPEAMPPGEPGGPDSEVFFAFTAVEHNPAFGKECHPNCDCGRFMEIANSVFMQYRKMEDGTLAELPKKNVDFGGGLERLTAATEDNPDIFQTDLFSPVMEMIGGSDARARRIVADHVRAAVMMIADGVVPSNKKQGYVLRRLIRRAVFYGRDLGVDIGSLVAPIARIYHGTYPAVFQNALQIKRLVEEEAMRFEKTLERGIREAEKLPSIDGKTAFYLYESFGFPWELTAEIAASRKQHVDYRQFEEEFRKHQELSRTAAAGMFRGGLADQSEATTKLHTATHLLHAALREVLGEHVQQRGSNITPQRLRFDFSHPVKLTTGELETIEGLVNEKIRENLPVTSAVMHYNEAIASGALAFFGERYPPKVSVYSIGSFSKEICGGPHVTSTGALGSFRIIKEESAGSGIRRIYATVG